MDRYYHFKGKSNLGNLKQIGSQQHTHFSEEEYIQTPEI